MLRCSLFILIFYLGSLTLPATLDEIDIRQEADHSKHPYKHFGRHYEYIYETPSAPDQKSRFLLSYDTISDDTDKTGTIRQINNAKRHKPKKHWQSKAEQLQFLNTEPEQFERRSKNPSSDHKTNFLPNLYAKNAWKENENARKRAQAEYEIVRQLADDIFGQAKEQMSRFPTFDISRFQEVFSAVTAVPAVLPENSLFRRGANPEYDLTRFQSMEREDRNLQNFHEQPLQKQYSRHWIMKNDKQKMKANNEVGENRVGWYKDEVGRWTRNDPSKQYQNSASYQILATLPKFDPRFPFDRAYKLMEGLRPPELFKFPSNRFYT